MSKLYTPLLLRLTPASVLTGVDARLVGHCPQCHDPFARADGFFVDQERAAYSGIMNLKLLYYCEKCRVGFEAHLEL